MSEVRRMEQDIEEILLDKETIEKRVQELGAQLTKDYAGKEVVMIGILIDVSAIQEEIYKAFIDPSFCDQILSGIRVCHVPQR